MLYSLDEKKMKDVPLKRKAKFQSWMKKLKINDYQSIKKAINEYCDGKEVVISSYIPGCNWIGTPYEPIYHICNMDQVQAGFFFGLIVWKVMIDRQEKWYFKPADSEDDALGTTYFRPKTL